MNCLTIAGHASGQTIDLTPLNLVIFEMTDHAAALIRILLTARNPATGASKAWDGTALIKRDGITVVNAANRDFNTPLVSAADTTPMAGCTITFFTDGLNIGIACQGPDVTTINWCLEAIGRQLID